jgi:hypothetical protein
MVILTYSTLSEGYGPRGQNCRGLVQLRHTCIISQKQVSKVCSTIRTISALPILLEFTCSLSSISWIMDTVIVNTAEAPLMLSAGSRATGLMLCLLQVQCLALCIIIHPWQRQLFLSKDPTLNYTQCNMHSYIPCLSPGLHSGELIKNRHLDFMLQHQRDLELS